MTIVLKAVTNTLTYQTSYQYANIGIKSTKQWFQTSVLNQVKVVSRHNIEKQKIVVCGGGNASHVLFGLSSLDPNNNVHLLSSKANEIKQTINKNGNKLHLNFVNEKKEISSNISDPNQNITNDPKCMKNADIIMISLPAFSHSWYLNEIVKNVGNHKCLISMFPGSSGLEFDWNYITNNCKYKDKYTLLSGITLPWNVRINENGNAQILGTKAEIEVSMLPIFNKNEILKLNNIFGEFGPELVDGGHIINMSLGYPNLIIHSCILYGQWNNWNGKPYNFAEIPLFYDEMTEEISSLIMEMCDEVVIIANRIAEESNVFSIKYEPLYKSVKVCYSNYFKQKISFYETMTTNPGYVGRKHPLKGIKTDYNYEDMYVPDWQHRYFTEDIPFGLAVIKGYALLLKNTPKTPVIDLILQWAQNKMNKEYFIYKSDGTQFPGKHIHETRTPQKFNIKNIQQMMSFHYGNYESLHSSVTDGSTNSVSLNTI
eukprot:31135_1